MFGELSGSPGEATPIGVARSAMSQATVGVVEEVMPGGLISTHTLRQFWRMHLSYLIMITRIGQTRSSSGAWHSREIMR